MQGLSNLLWFYNCPLVFHITGTYLTLSSFADIKDCETGVLKQIRHLPLTIKHLTALMHSLPGKPIKKEDIENTLKSCDRPKQILKLLSLWRDKNGGDTIEGLKQLTTSKLPKMLRKPVKKLERFLNGVNMYRLFEKIILQINGTQSHLGKSDSLLWLVSR